MDVDALGLGHRLAGCAAVLRKARIKKLQHRDVQAIKPHDGLIDVCMAAMPMIMPGPARCDDEVAWFHLCTLAINRRVRTMAFHHKTQRALGVAVAGCNFARHDDLQARVQRLGDARLAGEARVFKNQHPAHRLFSADELAGLHQVGADVAVFPVRWMARRVGRRWHQCVQHFPQRTHAVLGNRGVKLLSSRCVRLANGCSHVHGDLLKSQGLKTHRLASAVFVMRAHPHQRWFAWPTAWQPQCPQLGPSQSKRR